MIFDIFAGLESLGFKTRPKQEDIFTSNTDKKKTEKKTADAPPVESLLYKRKMECPVCGNIFETTAVRHTQLKFVSSSSDLRPTYESIDPIYYDVIICEKCGYAAMTSIFPRCIDRHILIVREKITPQFIARQYPLVLTVDDAIERYKLALMCSVVREVKASEKALLCLRLSWLMRDKGSREGEAMCVAETVKGFMTVYEKETLPVYGMDGSTLAYLVGELLRRQGRRDEALKWLSITILSKTAQQKLKDRAVHSRELIMKARKLEEMKAYSASVTDERR